MLMGMIGGKCGRDDFAIGRKDWMNKTTPLVNRIDTLRRGW